MIRKISRGKFYFWPQTQPACIQFNKTRNYIQTVYSMLSFNQKSNSFMMDDANNTKDLLLQNFDFFFLSFSSVVYYIDKKHSPFTLQKRERENWVNNIHTHIHITIDEIFFYHSNRRKIRSFSILFPKQYLFTHFFSYDSIFFCAPFSHLRWFVLIQTNTYDVYDRCLCILIFILFHLVYFGASLWCIWVSAVNRPAFLSHIE